MHTLEYTYSLATLSQIRDFIAINSRFEVDLTGQISAETIDGEQISGVGGQLDFIRGARFSPGGKAILALPATTGKGNISRIVSKIGAQEIVTTPRGDVDYVVTEYGIAPLRGKSRREHAEALLQIAHPRFREELAASLTQDF